MSSQTNYDYEMLWVDEFRPRKLSELIGQDEIVSSVKNMLNEKKIPHIIMSGSSGTGKTTLCSIISREILGENIKSKNVYLELNASDERGINVIRTRVKDFLVIKKPNDVPFKILVLEEMDDMSQPAQSAFRRMLESYSDNCRVIMLCNYLKKVILPIQTRASIFQFRELTKDQIKEQLNKIKTIKNVNIDDSGLEALSQISEGDCRKSINYLQALHNLDIEITDKVVYEMFNVLPSIEIREFIQLCYDGNLLSAKEKIIEYIDRSISGDNLIKQIKKEIKLMDLPINIVQKIIIELSDIQHKLIMGATEEIQLISLITRIYHIVHSN